MNPLRRLDAPELHGRSLHSRGNYISVIVLGVGCGSILSKNTLLILMDK
jgi:hypothetical protein